MRLPSDNNKVIPEVFAECLTQYRKGGSGGDGGGIIIVPPIRTGGTGVIPPKGHTGGGTGPGKQKYCKCFPMPSRRVVDPAPGIPGFEECVKHTWTWEQTCLETDSNGLVNGSHDPLGGYADMMRVFRDWWKAMPFPWKLIRWAQSDINKHGHSCKNVKSGDCTLPCEDIWVWALWCKKDIIIDPEEPTPSPNPAQPAPPPPPTPPPNPAPGPIMGGGLGGGGGPKFLPPVPNLIVDNKGNIPGVTVPSIQTSSDRVVGNPNIPGGSRTINPQTYAFDDLGRNNIPRSPNTMFTFIPSPYDTGYVFHNYRDLEIINEATVTEPKAQQGDINNIFKKGYINKLLNTYLIPQNSINTNIYNDRTVSIFMNNRIGLVNDNLSEETKETINLVGKSNLISLNLSQQLKAVISSAVISGTLNLYTPQLFRDMYEVGQAVLGNAIPPKVNSPTVNMYNALSYISKNLRSLYPKNYPNSGDDARFSAHWLALPPEYQLALGVTPRVGDPKAIEVGLNFTFPVYERDGSKRNVDEFLDFFKVMSKDMTTEKVVPLNSNRRNLYSLGGTKESRVLELLSAGPAGLTNISQTTTTYTVSSPGWSAASGYELNSTPLTLHESYLVKLSLSSITQDTSPGSMMRGYTAVYDLVWSSTGSDEAFNSQVSGVFGPHRIVYLPPDSWWHYFVSDEDARSRVTVSYNSLNVEGYLPDMPEAIVGTQMDYTILFIPTKDKIKYNPFNGESTLEGFEEGSIVKRKFTGTINPFEESETFIKPVKNTTEVNLQGDADIFALKFSKDFSKGDLSSVVRGGSDPLTTSASPVGDYITRVSNLKSNYNLAFDGSNTLTQFDLYKGFSLNKLITILSETNSKNLELLTDVRVILTKVRDIDIPKSFLTSSYLKIGGTANTSNYIGGSTFPKIQYFPPEYNYYN